MTRFAATSGSAPRETLSEGSGQTIANQTTMALRPPLAARTAQAPTEPTLRRGLLPGWAASIWFHALVLVVAAFGLRSCTGPGQRGEAEGDWKSVGLVTRMESHESSNESQDSGEDHMPAQETLSVDPLDSSFSTLEAMDAPPVELPGLPGAELPPVVGPGAGVPKFETRSSESSAATMTGGVGEISGSVSGAARGDDGFFGIRDEGSTFVYVIDSSGSMAEPEGRPWAAARAELMASLETLNSNQQFQVIFYSERPLIMRLPGQAPQRLYWISDINRTLARQFIAVQQPNAGTDHMRALRAALEIGPDAIFFLTDADDPALTARDLDEVRRLNRGNTRIHAVEFGKGAKLKHSTALERLASQNGGRYEYRDVNPRR